MSAGSFCRQRVRDWQAGRYVAAVSHGHDAGDAWVSVSEAGGRTNRRGGK